MLNILGILVMVNNIYTLIAWPCSEIISNRFTPCITHTIEVIAIVESRKNDKISNDNLRNINLFIEIINLINIQHYLLNISKKWS